MTDPFYIDLARREKHIARQYEKHKRAEEDVLSGYIRPSEIYSINFTPEEAKRVADALAKEDYMEIGRIYFQAAVNWRADELD